MKPHSVRHLPPLSRRNDLKAVLETPDESSPCLSASRARNTENDDTFLGKGGESKAERDESRA
jgi:hypothetical protein